MALRGRGGTLLSWLGQWSAWCACGVLACSRRVRPALHSSPGATLRESAPPRCSLHACRPCAGVRAPKPLERTGEISSHKKIERYNLQAVRARPKSAQAKTRTSTFHHVIAFVCRVTLDKMRPAQYGARPRTSPSARWHRPPFSVFLARTPRFVTCERRSSWHMH